MLSHRNTDHVDDRSISRAARRIHLDNLCDKVQTFLFKTEALSTPEYSGEATGETIISDPSCDQMEIRFPNVMSINLDSPSPYTYKRGQE